MELSADNAIWEYALKNLTYKEISAILRKHYGIYLSPNAIGKRLKRSGMPSRKGPTVHSINEVKMAIQSLIPALPYTVGYRQMTDVLQQMNIHVRRDTVMKILKEIDPTGVEYRRRRRIQRKVYRTQGPNYVWHVDGYDKLKPYGFPIHGCIDGFSRKIMWLNVGSSNNDPAIVAHNFVSCVDELKACPMVLQTDPGTENCIMGALQCLFRHNSSDCFSGIHSYRVVRSVFNQRIEAWWSMMRRQQSDWWISFFKDLESFGAFCRGNGNHLRCIRYCFMPVLQRDLDYLLERWNNHYISRSRQAVCPNGRPNVLYMTPEEKGFWDYKYPVSQDDIEFAFSQCKQSERTGSIQFDLRVQREFQAQGWNDAENWETALQQYFHVINVFRNYET